MKNVGLLLIIIIFLSGCLSDDPWQESKQEFENYVSQFDTTLNTVKTSNLGCYIIYESLSDSSYSPKAGDIIELTYELKRLDGTLVGTNIKSLALESSFYNSQLLYGNHRMIPRYSSYTGIFIGDSYTLSTFWGIEEALLAAKPYTSYKVIVPAELAYGSSSIGDIPSYTNLILEINVDNIIPEEDIVAYENEVLANYINNEFEGMALSDSTDDGAYLYVYDSTSSGEKLNKGELIYTGLSANLPDGRTIFEYTAKNPYSLIIGFDSSPDEFQNALTLLSEGNKAKVLIPFYNLQWYGVPGQIPAFSTIVYDVTSITRNSE